MTFKVGDKEYDLDENLRNQVKPGWMEMLNPAKERKIKIVPMNFLASILKAEDALSRHKETIVGKEVLEIGCNEGARCYLMAKYHDTWVHGIDVDEYTVDQSPDLNSWNPKDVDFVHGTFDRVRKEIASEFPDCITDKVTFETVGMEGFIGDSFDLLIGWDTLEHIIDLPTAFKRMSEALNKGGIVYHEYNPFFAINGGHSLCTLDFLYGHCRLSSKDFERYIREIRPSEEKIDLNFYHKCLNRATRADIRKLAEDSGFEVLELSGTPCFGSATPAWKERIEREFLKEVQFNYPTATVDDLLCDFLTLILRKK